MFCYALLRKLTYYLLYQIIMYVGITLGGVGLYSSQLYC